VSRILVVGTATLDLVFGLDHYPDADEEMRACSLRTCRGGNAANTAVVLAGLGHAPEFLGVLADAPETAVIERDFVAHGVGFRYCPHLAGRPPTSSIYLSGDRRSIVHYRDLPELDAKYLTGIDLGLYDWLHFEGRNVPQLIVMMAYARTAFPALKISLELEKPREGVSALLGQADLLLCSRGFAKHHGFDRPPDFLRWMHGHAPQATITAAWGANGAYGLDTHKDLFHFSALDVPHMVDTLGAGDTFNAGMIDAYVKEGSLQQALAHGCTLAGKKCAVEGFDLR
jgi:ketohexokinase